MLKYQSRNLSTLECSSLHSRDETTEDCFLFATSSPLPACESTLPEFPCSTRVTEWRLPVVDLLCKLACELVALTSHPSLTYHTGTDIGVSVLTQSLLLLPYHGLHSSRTVKARSTSGRFGHVLVSFPGQGLVCWHLHNSMSMFWSTSDSLSVFSHFTPLAA